MSDQENITGPGATVGFIVLFKQGPAAVTKTGSGETTTPPEKRHPKAQGLDFALAAAAFGHDVMLIFQGESLHLLTDQTTPSDRFQRIMQQLDIYDLAPIHLCQNSLTHLGLTLEHFGELPVTVIDQDTIARSIQPPRVCLVF